MPEPSPVRSTWPPRERWLLAAILLVTALVRGGVLWAMRGNLEQDPDMYREIAENLLSARRVWPRPNANRSQPDRLSPAAVSDRAEQPARRDGRQVALWKVAMLHVL